MFGCFWGHKLLVTPVDSNSVFGTPKDHQHKSVMVDHVCAIKDYGMPWLLDGSANLCLGNQPSPEYHVSPNHHHYSHYSLWQCFTVSNILLSESQSYWSQKLNLANSNDFHHFLDMHQSFNQATYKWVSSYWFKTFPHSNDASNSKPYFSKCHDFYSWQIHQNCLHLKNMYLVPISWSQYLVISSHSSNSKLATIYELHFMILACLDQRACGGGQEKYPFHFFKKILLY